ncbi:AAA family ATPase [Chromatiales bacterium (ex Bugula neritina AB1)]|nr:AAA family ATPase [Chromatiales bacterium (ex Bugula neritina AB1)]
MKAEKRIMIIGQPGSGKSTLARVLGNLLSLPVFHIDHIHWQAGWVERPGPEKDRLCFEVHAKDSWIFEGGRSSTWPERLERADMLIWLDFPLSVRAYRVFKRTVQYHGRSRPDLPEGCPERFELEFTKWIWDTRKSGQVRMRNLYDSAPADLEKYWLRNQPQVDELVAAMAEQ